MNLNYLNATQNNDKEYKKSINSKLPPSHKPAQINDYL